MATLDEVERDVHTLECTLRNVVAMLQQYRESGPKLGEAIMLDQGSEYGKRLVTHLAGTAYAKSAQQCVSMLRSVIELAAREEQERSS